MMTSFHRRLCAVLTAITVFVAMSAFAVAQQLGAPLAPQQLQARLAGSTWATLTWMRNPQGGHADKFYVYYAKGQANSATQFTRIAQISSDNDTLQETKGLCTWYVPDIGAGTHTFYVSAWNDKAESSPSNYAYINGQSGGQTTLVRISSQQPTRQLIVGEATTYSPVAQISTDAGKTWASGADKVTFTLTEFKGMNWPANISIDPTTGTIAWTAVTQGTYGAMLTAQLNGQSTSATQLVYFLVKKCANSASIIGFLNDEKTGKPIAGGYVVATMKGNNANPNSAYDSMFTSTASVGSDGSFKLMVDEGEYYVQAMAQGYESEFFNDSKDMKGATTIVTQCGQIYTATFALAKIVVPNMLRVSGMVSDKESGKPVTPAIVTFVANGSFIQGTKIEMSYTAWTDANGNYEIQLPENKTYTAYANGYSRDSLNTGGAEYLVCYYDGADEPTTATSINLTADRADINFQLKKRQVYQNGISGLLSDSTNKGLYGNVVAYRIAQNAVTASRWTATEQNGTFSLQNLLPGEYVLFGYTTTKQFSAPGFYVNGELATLDWSKATRLTVSETGTIDNVAFRLASFYMMNGKGGIKGHCRNSGGIIKTGEKVQGATAVVGAVVYILDNKGTILDYTFSASDGAYGISTLKPGTFTLSAGRVGFGQLQQIVKVEDEITPVNTDINIKPTSPSGVEEPVTGSMTAYPNPATGESLAVTFDGRAGITALTLTNAAGVTVYSTEISVIDGTNTAVLPTGNFAPGAYMIRVANATIPVVIVR